MPAELRVSERAPEFLHEKWRDDRLEVPVPPTNQDSCGRSFPRDQSRNDDVGVEDCPHASGAARRTRPVLRLEREHGRLGLGQ